MASPYNSSFFAGKGKKHQEFPQKLTITLVNVFKLKKVRLRVSERAGHFSLAHEFAACPRGVLFPSTL